MSLTTNQIKNELDDTRVLLRTLRDEVRVKLHLASLEAQQAWKTLDGETEKLAREIGKASRETIDAAVNSLRKLNDSIDKA